MFHNTICQRMLQLHTIENWNPSSQHPNFNLSVVLPYQYFSVKFGSCYPTVIDEHFLFGFLVYLHIFLYNISGAQTRRAFSAVSSGDSFSRQSLSGPMSLHNPVPYLWAFLIDSGCRWSASCAVEQLHRSKMKSCMQTDMHSFDWYTTSESWKIEHVTNQLICHPHTLLIGYYDYHPVTKSPKIGSCDYFSNVPNVRLVL